MLYAGYIYNSEIYSIFGAATKNKKKNSVKQVSN